MEKEFFDLLGLGVPYVLALTGPLEVQHVLRQE